MEPNSVCFIAFIHFSGVTINFLKAIFSSTVPYFAEWSLVF